MIFYKCWKMLHNLRHRHDFLYLFFFCLPHRPFPNFYEHRISINNRLACSIFSQKIYFSNKWKFQQQAAVHRSTQVTGTDSSHSYISSFPPKFSAIDHEGVAVKEITDSRRLGHPNTAHPFFYSQAPYASRLVGERHH